MRNRTEAMNRLMRKMWMNGWAPVMGATIPFDDIPNPDAVFVKGGDIIIADMVYLPSGNSKRQVKDRSDELTEIQMRAEPSALSGMDNFRIGFIVAKSQASKFYWMDGDETNAHYQKDYTELDEVILE